MVISVNIPLEDQLHQRLKSEAKKRKTFLKTLITEILEKSFNQEEGL